MNSNKKINKTEAEWKQVLSDEVFHILREKGTERAFTGEYDKHFEAGTYLCAGCDTALFESNQKFDSHCGWPAFDKGKNGAVDEHVDKSFGMIRTEITCNTCGGHLGHVFNDGPTKTGLRYCINSLSLKFVPKA